MPKFGTKNALFDYFYARFLKDYCHISNQHPRISLYPDFAKKQKCLYLRSKMSYLSIFDRKCLIMVFLSSNFKKLMSYLKSAPSNLSNCKVLRRNKNA